MTFARMVRVACTACFCLLVLASGPVHAADAQAPAAAPPRAVPTWRAAGNVAVVTIEGAIDDVTAASVQRRMREAQASGANAIVLELDTPGGDLNATLELCLAIKDDTGVPVYAWVHPKAFSAGTILALACKGILVSPNAVFGDAAPIQAIPGLGLTPLPAAERAKIEAPVLAEVIDSARRRGYDETLVRTFVTTQEEAWMLRNRATNERVFVGRPEYRMVFGEEPPTMRGTGSSSASPRAEAQGEYSVRPSYDDRFRAPEGAAASGRAPAPAPAPTPTDLPSAEDIAAREEHIEFMQIRPPSRAPLTAADAEQWEVVAQVDGAEELLVVYAPEAKAFGLVQDIVANDAELSAYFGATQLWRLSEHWGDAVVRFLTSWPVRLLLVIVLLVGFLVEVAVPGLGWFGAAAAVALVLLLGAPLLGGIQTWWPVVLVLVGLLLIVAEVFLIPGVGIAGFLGAGCMLIGLVAAFIGAPLSTSQGQSDLTNALATVVGGGIISAIAAWAIVRALPRTRLASGAVLHAASGETGDEPGARVNAGVTQAQVPLVRVGQVGKVMTPLRPVGKAWFDGALIQVQSVGEYIDEGAEVVVVRASAYAVEVEERRS